ncbi:MAG: 7-carboxy-7-deazaguanine synthase QueE [Pseudomonadota bacterium]
MMSKSKTQTPTLRITEIFYSIQGEANTVGWPTVFVRLTGCPLRCSYCDTEYAFHGGKKIPLTEILKIVANYNPKYITVTGGEPLAQPACHQLLTQLCDQGYQVSLETSGAIDISNVDKRVAVVMDLKTPTSNEIGKNNYTNLNFLKNSDQIKFVIGNRDDYDWVKHCLDEYELLKKCQTILFSPNHEKLAPQILADWILADKLPVRLQLQMHKYIWGDVPGK